MKCKWSPVLQTLIYRIHMHLALLIISLPKKREKQNKQVILMPWLPLRTLSPFSLALPLSLFPISISIFPSI